MRQRIGNLDFDCASHCVYHLAVHVVFCTKFRRHILIETRLSLLDYAAGGHSLPARNR